MPDGFKNPRRLDLSHPAEMPDVIGGEGLLQYFNDIGYCSTDSQGRRAIQWTEMEAFQRLMGFTFSPWECLTLRAMSEEYVHTLKTASNPATRQPYKVEGDLARTDRIINSIFGK